MAVQPEKGKVIFIHRNGAPFDIKYGMRIIVHPRKTKTFDQLKNEMTARIRLTTGAVRNIYDAASGAELTDLDSFEHNHHYVCCGADRIKQVSLMKGATPKKSPKPKMQFAAPTPSPEKARVITVFRNGDRFHQGKKYIISKKRYQTMDQLYEDLSANVTVNTGAVRRLVSTKDINTSIEKIDDIEDKGRYICLGGEKGVDVANLPSALRSEVKASPGSASKRPGSGKKLQKFGTQSAKGRVIWAYVNGDKHHKGTKFVIHHKKFKTMEQLKLLMSNKMVLPTGPVLKVLHYDPALPRLVEEVKSLDDFIDNHHYVVCGAEKFNRTAIPFKLKELGELPPAAAPSSPATPVSDDQFLNPPSSGAGPLDDGGSSTTASDDVPSAPSPPPAEPEPEPVAPAPLAQTLDEATILSAVREAEVTEAGEDLVAAADDGAGDDGAGDDGPADEAAADDGANGAVSDDDMF